MVTLENIIPLLKKRTWFAIIDLQDAYFHITTIHPDYCKYLRFTLSCTTFKFTTLPFGLFSASLYKMPHLSCCLSTPARHFHLPLHR
ncbi:hypothetical protein JRQ81_004742 [Phrynocephalus forsythii]|uniref:Reverse transcriptase domain-containing protein n=1 Tax=Phrynocephalus forsythii TaxID=171643 RepID=A0A9Q0XIY0_9SAUR|nr:hypothetical protein JRQ81_004742 [Phrynocephalus forsythii]